MLIIFNLKEKLPKKDELKEKEEQLEEQLEEEILKVNEDTVKNK